MAKNVIIYVPSIGQDYLEWAMSDDSGALTSELHSGTFEEAAHQVEGRRATLVLPGDDVLLAEASVPGGSNNRALLAVPFVLEDQLADDVDSLHFALGTKSKDDIYPVAVVGRGAMDTIRDQCAEVGLRPTEIVPETLALPKFDAEFEDQPAWTALVHNDQAVVRLNGYKGFASDRSMAAMMLDGARGDLPEDTSASMVLFSQSEENVLHEMDNVDVDSRTYESRLSLYANGLATAPRINLLQGDYSPKTQFDNNWKPWRWPLALVGVLFATLFVGKYLDYRAAVSDVHVVDDRIAAVFASAMPGKRMVRPVSQIETRVKQLSGSGSVGGFTSNLSQIAASLATQPQTELRSISYRDGRFDLDLTTDAIPTLDLLKAELKKRGQLSMTVQSANREKDKLRSRVRIE